MTALAHGEYYFGSCPGCGEAGIVETTPQGDVGEDGPMVRDGDPIRCADPECKWLGGVSCDSETDPWDSWQDPGEEES